MNGKIIRMRSLGVLTVMLSVVKVFSGNLAPSNAPAPTMRSLQEIFDKLEEIEGTIESEGSATYNAAVPRTGQTETFRTGDDGDLRTGAVWPDPRFTDHEDGTVTDNLTGLMWTTNANLDGTKAHSNAVDYCNTLNTGAGTYGYTDWRLPNVRELHSLIDYGRVNPALPWGYPFTNVQSENFYWSSSTYMDDTTLAWCVYLYDGYVHANNQLIPRGVWPVRGGQ